MKALPQLLSCLVIASVALLNSSAALSSDAPANEELTKSSAGTTHKKAKKSLKRAKTAQKKTRKYHSQAKPVAQAPASVLPTAVAENAYLPSSTAPVVAKANMPAAAVAAATLPIVAATSVATASATSSDAPKEIPATPAAPLVLAKSLTLTSTAASAPVVAQEAPAVAQTAPVVVQKAPSSNPWNTGAAAGIQAQTQKADTIIARSSNPYLAYNAAYNTTYNQPFTAFNPVESLGQLLSGLMFSLPSLPSVSQPSPAAFNQTPATPNAAAAADLGQMFNSLRNFLPEPHLPSADIDILPSITKVYPTGEKPLYVLTFKCPTELIGITPLPTKALRWLITTGMDGINSTNLLSFNMQQVCQ
ncbi:MAG: hypothetical protein KKG92_08145 [Gammaproteobacteria bacterium]|nr:hypothetical protein [Gammaproteobacteria bacterium]